MKKDNLPNPFTYKNPNEIYSRNIAKKDGEFSMPRSERTFNFTKFSSLH